MLALTEQQTLDAYHESEAGLDYEVWLKVWKEALAYFQRESTPKIVGVAIKADNRIYKLPAPNRHHMIFQIMHDSDLDGVLTEGFYDSNGDFLNRRDAMARAQVTKQLNRQSGDQFYQGPDLFSEDLW